MRNCEKYCDCRFGRNVLIVLSVYIGIVATGVDEL